MKNSPKLQALLDARPGVRNLTYEGLLTHLRGLYQQTIQSIPEWETLEANVPRRTAEGGFERDPVTGLVVCDLRRVSKQAHVAQPLLEKIEQTEQVYIDQLESYVDAQTARVQQQMCRERMKDEGFGDDMHTPEARARHAEIMAEYDRQNRATVAAQIAAAMPAPAPKKAKAA